MILIPVELHVHQGLADSYNLTSAHYGLILHWRESAGTRTREVVEFRSFRAENADPLDMPGISVNRERLEFQRGHGTDIDLRLIRSSAFNIDLSHFRRLGPGVMQSVHVLVAPKGDETFSTRLGLTLCLGNPPIVRFVECVRSGPGPLLLWTADEWKGVGELPNAMAIPDMVAYVAAIQARFNGVVEQRERAHLEKLKAIELPPPPPHSIPTPTPTTPTPTPTPTPPVVEVGAKPGPLQITTPLVIASAVAVAVAYMAFANWQGESLPTSSGAIEPKKEYAINEISPPARQPTLEHKQIVVPIGNSAATREQLYAFGFDNHLTAVKNILAAARVGNVAMFDQNAAWLRANKPKAVTWPQETAQARREFNEQIDLLINTAKRNKDDAEIERAVQLSEQFLKSHFGYSTAHLNLSIALASLNQGKSALVPAFHSIVFNPDGANGYVALGLAFVRSGDPQGATDAFCTVLRKVRYSEKTVTYFGKIARAEDFDLPGVAAAMTRTEALCPKEKWGIEYPPS